MLEKVVITKISYHKRDIYLKDISESTSSLLDLYFHCYLQKYFA